MKLETPQIEPKSTGRGSTVKFRIAVAASVALVVFFGAVMLQYRLSQLGEGGALNGLEAGRLRTSFEEGTTAETASSLNAILSILKQQAEALQATPTPEPTPQGTLTSTGTPITVPIIDDSSTTSSNLSS